MDLNKKLKPISTSTKMKSIDELKAIAESILKSNEECFLTGSLALTLQGHTCRRQPKDIDIYMPFDIESFTRIEGLNPRTNLGDNDEYDNEYYERTGYVIDGVEVDVFTPIDDSVPELINDYAEGFNVIKDFEIMKMKIQHAMGEHYSRYKHKDDIISLMANIT